VDGIWPVPYRNVVALRVRLFNHFLKFNQKDSSEMGESRKTSIALDESWCMLNASAVDKTGIALSSSQFPGNAQPAVVPGTVLTSFLVNKAIEDPFFGNNGSAQSNGATNPVTGKPDGQHILDISEAGGAAHYTYWFLKSFDGPIPNSGERNWLDFRGINYKAEIFLNGTQLKLEDREIEGMFQRFSFDVTGVLTGSNNRLAVLVHPPTHYSDLGASGGGNNANNIGNCVTMRYTAGWDWMPPVADRNTGIWDKVTIEKTGPVRLRHPHVMTNVTPLENGAGFTSSLQASVELDAPDGALKGTLSAVATHVDADGKTHEIKLQDVQISADQDLSAPISFPTETVSDPLIWWPNNLGNQPLYDLILTFTPDGQSKSDEIGVTFGIREINVIAKDTGNTPNCRHFRVNGRKVFLRGGNWIGTDAMLRLTDKRYDDEVRMHAEMNLSIVRVWGGSIAERPEFYDACDRYGMLVMQDFWRSGEYPLNNSPQIYGTGPDALTPLANLFLACAEDTAKMLRNHPSLMFWCAGNELYPDGDIFTPVLQERVSAVDPSRIMVDRSTNITDVSSSQYCDGRYGMIAPGRFYNPQPDDRESNPLNPEIGYIGMPIDASVRRMMPTRDADAIPAVDAKTSEITNPSWQAHFYANYNNGYAENGSPWDFVFTYGAPRDLEAFCDQAQLANYIENKALFEGATSQMWTQNIGVMVWKSQNPYPALAGQAYDNFLHPTGGYYGARKACEPIHVQLNLQEVTGQDGNSLVRGSDHGKIEVVNTSHVDLTMLSISVTGISLDGKAIDLGQSKPISVTKVGAMSILRVGQLKLPTNEVYFLKLELLGDSSTLLSRNVYFLPLSYARLEGLCNLAPVQLVSYVKKVGNVPDGRRKFQITLTNPGIPGQSSVAMSVFLEARTLGSQEPMAPAFLSDNYLTIVPQDKEVITMDISDADLPNTADPEIWVKAWNCETKQLWPK
jgi:hypothetical protein